METIDTELILADLETLDPRHPALEVGVDDAGRLRGLPALADRPGARLLRAGGEVGLQAERVEADAGELVEARLVLTGRREQLRGILGVEVDELRLDLRVEEHGVGGRDERLELGLAPRHPSAPPRRR